ncbi:MAG: hypothetical protein A2044_03880 [Candidatus Firestonebacteria bacterium GWA2_43_8]|nr:MAG: hypothetical protein A2044_03880 [Candidatus Firestonebacteria bacterium GWA2_43_8]
MLKFWIIAVLLFFGAIFIASLIVNLLKLSFAVFKGIFIVLLVLALFFIIAYYAGLLEKLPVLNELFMKLKEMISPAADKAIDIVRKTT